MRSSRTGGAKGNIMADILEFMHKDKVFTPTDIIEEKITSLMVRMADYKKICEDARVQELIESWRTDLVRIRNAVVDSQKEQNIREKNLQK